MTRYIVIDADEQLDSILSDFGFSILKDLEKVKLTPPELTELLKDKLEEIVTNEKARIYVVGHFCIKKQRLSHDNKGKSNGLRVYLIINMKTNFTITPIRLYSAKHKPKNENKEEMQLKKILDSIING